jgi:hypothetical protein
MREERRLRVSEKRVLRRILGHKWDEVTGAWRKLNNEELNYLYTSSNIIRVIKSRRIRWEGHVACIGKRRGSYRILVGKPEGKRPLVRPKRRWKDNIKLVLQEVGWAHGLDRSGSGEAQVASTCKRGNTPSDSIKCEKFLDQL